MKNILILTSSFDKKNITKFKLSKNIKLKFNPYGRKITEKELFNLADDNTIGIISGTEQITGKILNKMKNLQVISRCGTGIDNIDKSAFKRNIKIFKTDKEPVLAVAEFVVTQILISLKNSTIHDALMKKKKWTKVKGGMISRKKIGIIGYGKIGKLIKKLLTPFNCEYFIYDPKIEKFSKKKYLDFIIENCNIITLNIPYSLKNKNFIDKVKINKMRKDAILVNCSRGGLIDEKALYNKLKKNKNFRSILDCYDNEPYYGNLTSCENAILSPHVASFTKETRDLMEKNSFLNCIKNLNIKKI